MLEAENGSLCMLLGEALSVPLLQESLVILLHSNRIVSIINSTGIYNEHRYVMTHQTDAYERNDFDCG